MSNSKRKLRILSFLGVLVISGGLLMGLFQEARAVDIAVSERPSEIADGDVATFTVSVDIPKGEKLPVSDVRTVIEKTDLAGPSFENKQNPTVVTDATCKGTATAELPVCSSFEDLDTAIGDAIRSIEFVGANPNDLAGYGYETCGNAPGGACTVTHTGYAFTTNKGYGYERTTLDDTSYTLTDATGGYGYDDGTLTLKWNVTVDTGNLDGPGNYWLTFQLTTGSDVIGELEGKAEYFELTADTGGGGGGGGGDGGPGLRSVGLATAFDASANERVKIILEGEVPGFQEMLVRFNRDCSGCSLHVTSHGSGPPSGTDAVPDHARAIEYFSIEVRDEDGDVLEGYVADGSIQFEVDPANLDDDEDAEQVALLHRTNPWEFEPTQLVSSSNADPLVLNGTFESFSVFAKAVDTEAPEITNERPTGSTSSVTPRIAVDWTDNRGIDTSTATLTLDGTEQSDEAGSLSVTESGMSFVPAETLERGEHDVTVEVSDSSGLTATHEWSFRVSEVTCPQPPRITSVEPASDATGVDPTTQVKVFIQKGTCPIATSQIQIDGQPVVSSLDGNLLTADIPTESAGKQVNATATVTDTGENVAERSWSFETADAGPAPGPGDDGGGALVWVIIALVILAIVGVGAYFYTEQRDGGGPPGGT